VKLREATGGSNSPANSLQPHNARRDVGGVGGWRQRENFAKPKRRSYSPSVSIKSRHFSTSSFPCSGAALARGQSLVIHLYKYAEVTCVGHEIQRNKKYRKYLQRGAPPCGGTDRRLGWLGGRKRPGEGALAFKNELANFITF